MLLGRRKLRENVIKTRQSSTTVRMGLIRRRDRIGYDTYEPNTQHFSFWLVKVFGKGISLQPRPRLHSQGGRTITTDNMLNRVTSQFIKCTQRINCTIKLEFGDNRKVFTDSCDNQDSYFRYFSSARLFILVTTAAAEEKKNNNICPSQLGFPSKGIALDAGSPNETTEIFLVSVNPLV